MKKHLNYWLALALLLPALHACQDDNTMPSEEPGTAGTPTVVSASIGDEPGTRAQVQWGTQNVADGEFFMWNAGDQFTAYNITTAETTALPAAYTFDISDTYNEAAPSREADFSCANGFPATVGNKVAAFYAGYYGNAVTVTDPTHGKGIQAVLEKSLSAQSQTATPGHADLKHLRTELCMYAIGQADGNGSISPLSFHHLSALFRITIRNQKSDEAKIRYTGISFPESEKIICNKKKVTVWDDNTVEYEVADNEKYSSTGNFLQNTDGQTFAAFATIAPGSSYDCFFPAMPVVEGNTASSIKINVHFDGDIIAKSLTIDGFTNVKIEAGMRYWFDLTVKADGTLAQTSTLTDYTWYTANTDATGFNISTPEQLRALARLVNGDPEALSAAGVSGPVSFEGKTISLAGDINLGNEAWTPIGNNPNFFEGTFDGGGHHISGLNVNNGSNNYAGLFGGVGGKVSNLRVSGKVTTTGNYVGGIAGTLVGGSTVENCIFNGNISGAISVGGIVGSNNDGTIAGCHTKGNVEATNAIAGGISGSNTGDITACYSEATITDAGGGIVGQNNNSQYSISHCYATGRVSGIWYIGGIIGQHIDGTVENCIALNPALTRTLGSNTQFGRIAGELNTIAGSPILTSCAAFQGMTIKDAGDNDIYTTVGGEHGDDLSATACLAKDTYTTRGFAEPATGTNGWAFDPAIPWTYLPWNPAFESFPGIQPDEYRISVPQHITDALAN